MTKRVITGQDDRLRREVVDTIIAATLQDPEFSTQKGWTKWTRQHKELLVGLFSGQGINRLGRVVAWMRREQINQRRVPAEVLCLLRDGFARQDLPESVENALAFLGIQNLDDLLRMAMLDGDAAKVLLAASRGSLEADLQVAMR